MSRDCARSIEDIVCSFPKEKLLVKPPHWNPRHLHLLNCRFEAKCISTCISNGNHEDEGNGSGSLEWFPVPCYAKLLSNSGNRKVRQSAIGRLLAHPGSLVKECSKTLHFFYAKRSVYQQKSIVFSYQREHDIKSYPVAYIDYNDIIANRGGSTRAQSRNEPQDWVEDPTLAAIIISVAQQQSRALTSPNLSENVPGYSSHSREVAVYTPRLLVTNPADKEYIHLYEASVPSEFLRKFEEPSYSSPIGIVIERFEIPFRPYESLGERLTELLIIPQLKKNGKLHTFTQSPSCLNEPPETNGRKRQRTTTDDNDEIVSKRRSR